MENNKHSEFHCGVPAQPTQHNLLDIHCSCIQDIFQPCQSNFQLSNLPKIDVSSVLVKDGIIDVSATELISQPQANSITGTCNADTSDTAQHTLWDHSLLTPTSVFTSQSSVTLTKSQTGDGLFYGEEKQHCNVNPQFTGGTSVMTTSAAFNSQSEDSLFSDTMCALLQSTPLSLEQGATAYYDNYVPANPSFSANLNLTSEERELSDVSGFKKKKMPSQTLYSAHSEESDGGKSFNCLANTNDVSANALPTLRSLLESDYSGVLLSSSVEECCSHLSSQSEQLKHSTASAIDESQRMMSMVMNQTPMQHLNLPIQKSFSFDSSDTLNSDATFIHSRSGSQSPVPAFSMIRDQFSNVIHSNMKQDSCYVFDNEDAQTSVIRRYENLQLNESITYSTNRSDSTTSRSPILEPNCHKQPKFFKSELTSHQVFMQSEGLPCDGRPLNVSDLSISSLSFGSHNLLHHQQSIPNAMVTHCTIPSSTLAVDNTSLIEDQDNHSLTGTTQPALLAVRSSTSSTDVHSSIGQVGELRGNPEVFVSPTYHPHPQSDANKERSVDINAASKLNSVHATQRFHNSQLVLAKNSRPVHRHHRYVSSNSRDSSISIGSTSGFSGSVPRLTGAVHARDRSVELVHSQHPPTTSCIDPHMHMARQMHSTSVRTANTVHRGSLLPCPLGTRKRTNRSTGLVNHGLSNPFVGITPCIRRKYAFSAPHRIIGARSSHPAQHRASTSASTVADASPVCSIRPIFNTCQPSDSLRSHPPSLTPNAKPFSTTIISPALRHPFNTMTPSLTARTFPSPYQVFPDHSTLHQCRIHITSQPESQHRARYQTEGSRGAVKDRSGTGYPSVMLCGWNGRASLQVFVACESGRVRPHPFYQAYLVAGKATKYCLQTILDGVNVVEMSFPSWDNWTLSVECVGILKLRKSDVEHRAQANCSQRHRPSDVQRGAPGTPLTNNQTPATHKLGSRRPGKARLVFRAFLFQEVNENRDSFEVIQVASEPILCTQLVGDPEICRMSLTEASFTGGQDLFLLGKNLGKDCCIWFRERSQSLQSVTTMDLIKLETFPLAEANGDSTYSTDSLTAPFLWQAEGILEMEHSHQTHLVCRIPAYTGPSCPLMHPLDVELVVSSGERWSLPHQFTYLPASISLVPITACEINHMGPETLTSRSIAQSLSVIDTKIDQHLTDQHFVRSTTDAFSGDIPYSTYCNTVDSFQMQPLSTMSYSPTPEIQPTVTYNADALPLLPLDIPGVDVMSMELTVINSIEERLSNNVVHQAVPDYPPNLSYNIER